MMNTKETTASAQVLWDVPKIRKKLLEVACKQFEVPIDQFDCSRPITEQGLNSLKAINIVVEIESALGLSDPIHIESVFYDYPTIDALAEHLYKLKNSTQ